ncbi:MAG: LysM peptidoglycan-binding domain-containing protein [Anaerolineaceae bacterium]
MQKNVLDSLKIVAICLVILLSLLGQAEPVRAIDTDRPLAEVAPWELISAMNTLRMANGLPPLIEDPIINAVAQSTAQIMADTLATWHIGDAPGRIQAAGYGGGARVLATENFAVGSDDITLDIIMFNYWNDADHMLPAVKSQYCHIGAGSAKASNGMTYYVLQAAAVAGQACAPVDYPVNPVDPNNPNVPIVPGVPQIIIPVEKVEPDESGNYVHVVKMGQSFWSIAVAYGVTGDQIRGWNNLYQSYVLQPGDELTILGPNAQNYATPTPSNQVILSTPEADGRIVHVVKVYQNLEIIARTYGVSVDSLLTLNGWSVDWPLQVDQKLLIKGPNWTPTPTELPLSPIEMLTPAADGKYYHLVKDGQNPAWIAGYYGVTVDELLAWNYLTKESILYVGDKLLLNVTPPATNTPTPLPATPTPPPSATPTATLAPTRTLVPTSLPTPTSTPAPAGILTGASAWLWGLPVLAIALAAGYVVVNERKKKLDSKSSNT